MICRIGLSAPQVLQLQLFFVDTLHRDGVKALFVNVAATGKSTDIRLVHKATALTAGKTYMVRFWAKPKECC